MSDATKDAVKTIGRIYLGDDYNPSENSPEVKKVRLLIHPFSGPITSIFYRQYSDSVMGGAYYSSIMRPGRLLRSSTTTIELSVTPTRSDRCGHASSWNVTGSSTARHRQ